MESQQPVADNRPGTSSQQASPRRVSRFYEHSAHRGIQLHVQLSDAEEMFGPAVPFEETVRMLRRQSKPDADTEEALRASAAVEEQRELMKAVSSLRVMEAPPLGESRVAMEAALGRGAGRLVRDEEEDIADEVTFLEQLTSERDAKMRRTTADVGWRVRRAARSMHWRERTDFQGLQGSPRLQVDSRSGRRHDAQLTHAHAQLDLERIEKSAQADVRFERLRIKTAAPLNFHKAWALVRSGHGRQRQGRAHRGLCALETTVAHSSKQAAAMDRGAAKAISTRLTFQSRRLFALRFKDAAMTSLQRHLDDALVQSRFRTAAAAERRRIALISTKRRDRARQWGCMLVHAASTTAIGAALFRSRMLRRLCFLVTPFAAKWAMAIRMARRMTTDASSAAADGDEDGGAGADVASLPQDLRTPAIMTLLRRACIPSLPFAPSWPPIPSHLRGKYASTREFELELLNLLMPIRAKKLAGLDPLRPSELLACPMMAPCASVAESAGRTGRGQFRSTVFPGDDGRILSRIAKEFTPVSCTSGDSITRFADSAMKTCSHGSLVVFVKRGSVRLSATLLGEDVQPELANGGGFPDGGPEDLLKESARDRGGVETRTLGDLAGSMGRAMRRPKPPQQVPAAGSSARLKKAAQGQGQAAQPPPPRLEADAHAAHSARRTSRGGSPRSAATPTKNSAALRIEHLVADIAWDALAALDLLPAPISDVDAKNPTAKSSWTPCPTREGDSGVLSISLPVAAPRTTTTKSAAEDDTGNHSDPVFRAMTALLFTAGWAVVPEEFFGAKVEHLSLEMEVAQQPPVKRRSAVAADDATHRTLQGSVWRMRRVVLHGPILYAGDWFGFRSVQPFRWALDESRYAGRMRDLPSKASAWTDAPSHLGLDRRVRCSAESASDLYIARRGALAAGLRDEPTWFVGYRALRGRRCAALLGCNHVPSLSPEGLEAFFASSTAKEDRPGGGDCGPLQSSSWSLAGLSALLRPVTAAPLERFAAVPASKRHAFADKETRRSPTPRALVDLCVKAGDDTFTEWLGTLIPGIPSSVLRRFAAWAVPRTAGTAAAEVYGAWGSVVHAAGQASSLKGQRPTTPVGDADNDERSGGPEDGLVRFEVGETVISAGSRIATIDFMLAGAATSKDGKDEAPRAFAATTAGFTSHGPPLWEPLGGPEVVLRLLAATVSETNFTYRTDFVAQTPVLVLRVPAENVVKALMATGLLEKPSTRGVGTGAAPRSGGLPPRSVAGTASAASALDVSLLSSSGDTPQPRRPSTAPQRARGCAPHLAALMESLPIVRLEPQDSRDVRTFLVGRKKCVSGMIEALSKRIVFWTAAAKTQRAVAAGRFVASRAAARKQACTRDEARARDAQTAERNRALAARNPVAELKRIRLEYMNRRADIIDQLRDLDAPPRPLSAATSKSTAVPPSPPGLKRSASSASLRRSRPASPRAPSSRAASPVASGRPGARERHAADCEAPEKEPVLPASKAAPDDDIAGQQAEARRQRQARKQARLAEEAAQKHQEKLEFMDGLMLNGPAADLDDSASTSVADIDYRPRQLRALVKDEMYASHVHYPLHLREARYDKEVRVRKRRVAREAVAARRARDEQDVALQGMDDVARSLAGQAQRLRWDGIAQEKKRKEEADAAERVDAAASATPRTPRSAGGSRESAGAVRTFQTVRAAATARRTNFEESRRLKEGRLEARLAGHDGARTVIPLRPPTARAHIAHPPRYTPPTPSASTTPPFD